MSEELATVFILADVTIRKLVLEHQERKSKVRHGRDQDERTNDRVDERDDECEDILRVIVVVLKAPRGCRSLEGSRSRGEFACCDE